MNIRRLLQHLLPKNFMPALQLSDAHQEIERAEFFEHLAHETHLHENAYVVSSNDRNAIWYFLRAALRGDANASFKLGVSYLHGDLGLDKIIRKQKNGWNALPVRDILKQKDIYLRPIVSWHFKTRFRQ